MMYIFPRKAVPKWAPFGLVTTVLILAVFMFKYIPSYFSTNDQLAYLTFVNGEVKVSDGITEVAASNGALIARNVRSLLKTGHGNASLKMPDGSIVIIDSASTIEFIRQNEIDPNKVFVFNLIKGRVLVVNEKTSRTPTQLFIGEKIAVRVFQATMGLEVTMDGKVRERVDCLVGQCLVNWVYLLKSGQKAQIGPGSTVRVSEGVPYDTWISLGRASNPGPALSALFASTLPTITHTVIPSATPKVARQAFPITGNSTITPTPSYTFTIYPTETPTSTRTKKLLPPNLPSPTNPSNRDPAPTATPTAKFPPIPADTSTPSKTPAPGVTVYPTYDTTPLPTDTDTPQPTPTPQPTSPPTPTDEPSQIPTPRHPPKKTPTDTLEPTATATFLYTPVPTDVPIPTEPLIPTETSIPAETQVPTDVIASTVAIAPGEVVLTPPLQSKAT